MAEQVTIDIAILQGIFGDLNKLHRQLGGISGGVAAVDSAAARAFGDMRTHVSGTTSAVNALDGSFDASMRNIVSDVMAPLAKTQELEDKLRRLGGQLNTAKSVGEVRKLKVEIAATQKELDGVNPARMEQRVGGAMSRMRSTVAGLAIPIAGAFAVGGVVGFTKSVVNAVAGAQTFNASMKVMLGGQEQALKMSKDLREFAIATPFDVAGLREYTTQLNSANVAQKDIIPTLDNLGNIAAGVGKDKLPQIVRAFTQMKGKGTLMGGELLQFQEAGVPLLDELAKVTGKSTSEISGNIAKMAIPFDVVNQALANMTAEGGKFHNLMAEQSQTVGGQLDAAGESWAGFLEDIGTALLPQITQAVDAFSRGLDGVRSAFNWVIENKDSIAGALKAIATVTAWYGTLLLWNNRALIQNKILTLGAAVADKVSAFWRALTTTSTVAATEATWSFNAALMANPAGLVIAGIMALVAGLIYCWNHFEGFRAFLYGLWASIKVVFSGIGDVIATVFGTINGVVSAVGQLLGAVFSNPFKSGYLDNITKGVKATTDAIAKVADLPSTLKDKMKANGVEAGLAYAKGDAEGRKSFKADQEKKATSGMDATAVAKPGDNVGADKLLKTGTDKGKGDGVTVGGSGSGRTITMDIKITNHISLPRDANMGVRELADKVTAMLVNKLNDAQYAMG
jgi:tape measure domain-containing protein